MKRTKLREVWSQLIKGRARSGGQFSLAPEPRLLTTVPPGLSEVTASSLFVSHSLAHVASRQQLHGRQMGQLALSQVTVEETETQEGEVTQVTQPGRE